MNLPRKPPSVRFPALCATPTQPIPLLDRDLEVVPARIAGRTSLGSLEASLIAKINGLRSIADLAALTGLSPREVLHLVAGLVDEGTVAMTSRRVRTRPRTDPPPATSPSLNGFVDFSDLFEELGFESAVSTQH